MSVEEKQTEKTTIYTIQRKHEWANCEKCPLQLEGGYVPSFNLSPSSRIAIVGESPGHYEAATGIPFTGPSGELLNEVLRHHGLDRSEVFIGNSVSCRPEGNADPPKAALDACAPRLHKEITESGVETIIAVGKAAAHSLLDSKASMRKMRVGPPKPYKMDPSIGVIATWHPAYSLRSPDSFPDLVFDFGKVKQGQVDVWTEPEYRVIDDLTVAKRAMQKLRDRCDRFVLDIECGYEKDSEFVHPSELPLLCVGIAFASKCAVVFGENVVNDPGFRSPFRDFLSGAKLIAHNGKFDLAGLRNVAGQQNLWFDTMLASASFDERPGRHGLKQLSIEKLGAPDYEAAIREFVPRSGNYADIPRDILYKYNVYDVVCTWDLYEMFEKELSYDARRKHDFMVKAANALIDLELAGITFDLEYNAKLHQEFENELNNIEEKINEVVGREINPRSVPQVQKYYASHGFILPTTNADFLTELSEKITGNPLEFTELLLLHRRRSKLFGTYIRGLAKKVYKNKVYTTYLLHGTTSGRLASRNPNLQNISRDKKIRNQFTVEHEDNTLIQLDYKQAEGRVIATLSKEEYLKEIFCDDSRDIFNELCDDIFGVGKWNKEQRVTMKSIFYGNAYGRKPPAIAKALHIEQGLDISVAETTKLMREFNALIPNVMAWQASVIHEVLSGNDLVTSFGRKRSFWLITDKNRTDVLNEALSFLPQSIASDICLEALIDVKPKLKDLATTRLTVHDALILECKKSDSIEVAEIVRETMVASGKRFTDYVPFSVDVSMSDRWGGL